MKPKRIFVYGSLKEGNSLHFLLGGDSEFVRHDIVRGHLYQAKEFPLLIPDVEGNEVHGEVWDVPFHVYNTLSRVEGQAGYEEQSERDFVYWSFAYPPHPSFKLIESGKWEQRSE